ncbi:hypothetical protein PR003_g3031 [Phytophthora rubi]|uniref:Uncharacterized protein n=1 Tax=Phytophthora rubi TaxID=129364 RepID=A0A6A4FR58_9STRA|nr:hypothetical protein PR001_g8851 [Phytophthora rubi]KAE9355074.1 hypothetical protein PR003_g3031 [Phytophthora rubi]
MLRVPGLDDVLKQAAVHHAQLVDLHGREHLQDLKRDGAEHALGGLDRKLTNLVQRSPTHMRCMVPTVTEPAGSPCCSAIHLDHHSHLGIPPFRVRSFVPGKKNPATLVSLPDPVLYRQLRVHRVWGPVYLALTKVIR